MQAHFSIINKTSKRIPRALLRQVFSLASKKHTMEVSLVFLDDRAMRGINKKRHKRDAETNVLAFLLDATVGEVAINPFEAEREARMYDVSCPERIAYLFVHGLLHLYGYDHKTKQEAERMERKEQNIIDLSLNKF